MRQNTSATADILDFHTQHSALTLTDPRQPEQRLVGVCHHFMLFLVSMLRARGVPARARCGFGAYLPRDQFLIAADA